ncbi:flavodoxin family protein [Actinomyces sp. B33]|uniref:flavodoxin family protein n=1 Tax=Actinomyces sp. B33 TaxID=2942131 RepID=UPI003FA4AD01
MGILFLQGSPRKDGGTRAMVGVFKRGAETGGNEATAFDVAGMDIVCRACEWCRTRGDGRCVQNDDTGAVCDEWDECDILVPASPFHHGSPTGQLPCVLHRAYTPGIPSRCKKTAMFLRSGASGVYDANRSICKGFVQGYFGYEDMGAYTATTSRAKGAVQVRSLLW